MRSTHLVTSEPSVVRGAKVWSQWAPEQLTPGYNLVTHPPPPTPCYLPPSTPKSLGPRSAPSQQHFNQAPPSRKRAAPRRLAKRAGEGARSALRYPSLQDRSTRPARTLREQEEPHVTYPALPSLPHKLVYVVRFNICHWSEQPLTTLSIPLTFPIISLPKPRAPPRM